jgi:phosphopantothenoylcysteine decarboxylase/phosphopantothenate--cysteine ligase
MKAWEAFAPITVLPVKSALDMHNATIKASPSADICILCAAVADFTPSSTAQQKIKKQPGQTGMTIEMTTTNDIAATLGKQKQNDQILVGFALETHDELQNAQRKLKSKNLDMIVLNSLQDKGAGFGTDTNKVTFLYPDSTIKNLPLISKEEVANEIVDSLLG